jgi:ribosomal-protein-alanine N-acetyltransferase
MVNKSSFTIGPVFAYLDCMTIVSILPALDTARLLLREMQPSDAPDLATYLVQPKYQRFISHRLKDEHEVVAFVRRSVGSQGDFRRRIFHLSGEDRSTRTVVGDGFIILHHDATAEIGWGVNPGQWKKGIGTEIGKALLALGFEHLKADKIWCKIMRENYASVRLAERIGMTLTKTVPDYAVSQRRREDVVVFQMDVETYFERPY